jgi:DNA-binding transcriptional LysR family regulator
VAYEEILHGRAEVAVITLAPEPHTWSRPRRCGTTRWISWWRRSTADQQRPGQPGGRCRAPGGFPGGNTFTHHIVQRLFEAQGLTPNIAMSTNYLETIKMMVSIGLAWSVLPRTMLDDRWQYRFAGHTAQSPARLYRAHRTDAVERCAGFHGLLDANRSARDSA